MKDNLIDFFDNTKNKLKKKDDDEYIVEDFEEWEADAEYFYAQDWENLIRERTWLARKYPDCSYHLYRLSEAYVFNKEYEKAIEYLSSLHKRFPEDPNIVQVLLDALFESGKDESSVEWVIPPKIINLSTNELDICYEFLKRKRKSVSLHDVYYKLYSIDSYLKFKEEDLLKALKNDSRFIIVNDTDYWHEAEVKVFRKNK